MHIALYGKQRIWQRDIFKKYPDNKNDHGTLFFVFLFFAKDLFSILIEISYF